MALVHMGDVEHSRKTIPRALFIAGGIILLLVISGPLVIAQILPPDRIHVVSGLLDTFSSLFQNLGLAPWLFVFILILVFAGNWGNATAWMISSTRAMQVACQSCGMPKIFIYTNRYQAPVGILLLEGIIFTCFALIMGLFPKIYDGYWFLLILASQIALIYYWLIFAAALRLRKTHPPAPELYRVPGKNWGIWVAAILGIASTGAAIVLGFFPPNETIGASFPFILFCALVLSFLIPAAFLHLSRKSMAKLNSEK
jgi:amino acid transporter